MNEKQLLALYGLKWNPFGANLPTEALWRRPGLDPFLFRVENLVLDGGFALITGQTGLGKSKALQILADRLGRIGEATVRVMERPQSNLGDFYRELGDRFEVNLSPSNRFGGFRALREKWRNHIKDTLLRPILLIDEAQEVATSCLNELRLLGSVQFDSQCILSTVLCGDDRLPERFGLPELVPLGSRIRTRLLLENLDRDEALAFLDHSLEQAGAQHIMTQNLKQTLADHCAQNLRVLTNMASDLLAVAAERQITVLDENLYLEVFSRQPKPARGQKTGTPALAHRRAA